MAVNKQNVKTDYEYCAINDNGKFDFQDFVGQQRAEEFAKKFGLLIAFSLFCNGTDDFVESVRSGGVKEIQEFLDINVNQVLALKEYFNLFFVRVNANGTLSEGWLKQIHRSAGGGDNFLFNASLFSPSDLKSLMKLSWNKNLYRTEGIGKDNHYSTGIFGSKFDSFKKQFLLTRDKDSSWKNITNNGEQLNKLIYDTLSSLYNFK